MNHDITHCRKEDCPSKGICLRFLAYLDAVDKKMSYISMFSVSSLDIKADGKCVYFLEYKK